MKTNKGITLVALVITIIIMTIIASIAVYEGKDLITKSKIQTQIANMSTIKANAKKYVEEIEAKIWQAGDDKETKRTTELSSRGLTKSTSNSNEYIVEESGFEIIKKTFDLHNEDDFWRDIVNIETEHEKMFSEDGVKIKALIAKNKM